MSEKSPYPVQPQSNQPFYPTAPEQANVARK